MAQQILSLCLSDNLLKRIDERVFELRQKKGLQYNRSRFISEGLEYYLTCKYGFSNIIKRNKVEDELQKDN